MTQSRQTRATAALGRFVPGKAPENDLERLVAGVRAAFRTPGLSEDEARRVAALALDAAAVIRRRRDDTTMRRLQADLDAHRSLIRRLSSSLRDCRRTYAEALAAARSGVWECRLRDERLEWTAGVHEMFEMPAGAALRREDTLGRYAPASLAALEDLRGRAIAAGSGFELDAEIATAKGARRWIRIAARVERLNGVPVRLFGMKQDITEAKELADQTRRLAEADPLTGLAGRRLFDARLAGLASGALLLIDLDGFKQVNDTFGHAFGDECLKAAAARLKLVCREADLVARIGGDEFAVLIGPSPDRDAAERIARAIVEALSIPVEHGGVRLKLGASVGVAHADGSPPSELFTRADAALYAAKAAGRATFRSFVPGMSATQFAPARLIEAPRLAASAR